MWQRAVLFPDSQSGWAWARRTLLGLPHLVRVLVTLYRSGVREVILPPGSESLQSWLHTVRQERDDLPALIWPAQAAWPDAATDGPVLGVQGGTIFAPALLAWFREALGSAAVGSASPARSAAGTVLLSWVPSDVDQGALESVSCETVAARLPAPSWTIPPEVFCQPVDVLERPGGDRALLATVGKPTDRWHVTWVRGWTFPALRWLTSTRLTPNHITGVGFVVALVGCWFLAQGGYWSGIAGALLLYASWVLDCLDGTMARLTCAESAFGQKLDTNLGYGSSLAIFSALIWAVYGGQAFWKVAGAAFFLLGGIVLAHRLSEKEKASRAPGGRSAHIGLAKFLEKINHRDYAVVILLLAVVRGLHVFVWLSLVGVQLYWLALVFLLRRRQRAAVS